MFLVGVGGQHIGTFYSEWERNWRFIAQTNYQLRTLKPRFFFISYTTIPGMFSICLYLFLMSGRLVLSPELKLEVCWALFVVKALFFFLVCVRAVKYFLADKLESWNVVWYSEEFEDVTVPTTVTEGGLESGLSEWKPWKVQALSSLKEFRSMVLKVLPVLYVSFCGPNT